jgi:hypothetical protein
MWMSKGESEKDELLWQSSSLATNLTKDLIAASEGVLVIIQGKTLVANFADIQTAITAAQRVQWAVLGLSEEHDFTRPASAIWVHATDIPSLEAAGSLSLVPLEDALPGQILLDAEIGELLAGLPGLRLLPPTIHGLREVQWRTPESKYSRPEDEKALLALIRQLGIEDSELAAPQPVTLSDPVPIPALLSNPAPATVSPQLPAERREAVPHSPDKARRLWGMPGWLFGVSCSLVLSMSVLIVYFVSGKQPTKPPVVPLPPHQNAVVKVPDPVIVVPAQPAVEKEKHAVVEHPLPVIKKQPAPAANCNLHGNEIQNALQVAGNDSQQRRYKEAESQYKSVLACEPSNSAALNGLSRTQKALQAQNLSPNP